MSDDHERAADALERLKRRLNALLVSRFGIAIRHVWRHGLMAAGAQLRDQRIPAGTVVPVAVEQAEGGHGARSTTYRSLQPWTLPGEVLRPMSHCRADLRPGTVRVRWISRPGLTVRAFHRWS